MRDPWVAFGFVMARMELDRDNKSRCDLSLTRLGVSDVLLVRIFMILGVGYCYLMFWSDCYLGLLICCRGSWPTTLWVRLVPFGSLELAETKWSRVRPYYEFCGLVVDQGLTW